MALRDGVLRQGVLRQVHPAGSARPVVSGDRSSAWRAEPTRISFSWDLCTTMTKGSLCAMGGLTRCRSGARPFPQRISRGRDDRDRRTDYGATGCGDRPDARVTVTIDGRAVTVPAGTSVIRAAEGPASTSPSCATDSLAAFGSCRLCLVEIEGPGARRLVHDPCTDGMVVATDPRPARLRRGVMELYLSDHPLDCLTCAASGDCEIRVSPARTGCAEVRYGFGGAKPPRRTPDISTLFRLQSRDLHRLLALRAGLRRIRHLRPDRRRAAVSTPASPRCDGFPCLRCVSCGACVRPARPTP